MEKAELKGMFASGKMPAGAEYRAALTDILQTFPYFQLAQVYFAKQMYDTHEPEAPGRIKLASVYAPDRKAMYHLFKTSTDTAKTPAKEEVKYNFVYSSNTAKATEVSTTPPKTEVETAPILKNEPAKTEAFIKKEIEKAIPLQHPVEKPVKVIEKKAEPPKPGVVAKKEEQPVQAATPLAETTQSGGETVSYANEPISDSNLKYTFSSWLKVIPEISIEKKQHAKPITQQETSSIIDTFLKTAPSISRPKTEFFSSTKAAKLSITVDDELVSETLAKIYLAQGNLQKALKAYQTLLLRFPEKKNIFAPRIKEITTLIRENTKHGNK